MKSIRYLLPVVLAAAIAQPAFAQQEKQVIRKEQRRVGENEKDVVRERKVVRELPGHEMEKEKVTFLGVETAPVSRTVAAQLGLEPEIGLVVTRVQKESAAFDVLKEHDILMKFEDQLLIDSRQFSVLIRSKKPGDSVNLTLLRGGKEQRVAVKLGEREVPKMFGLRGFEFGPDMQGFQFFNGDGPGMGRLRELPGLAREELGDVFRMLGDEKGNWFKSPRVHVLRRGQGSTILNLNEGNFVYSDDEGSVEVNANDGKRQLTVKDASGKVTYSGSISSDDERKQLPAEVRERLAKIEGIDIDAKVGDDFRQEGAAIEKHGKTKISTRIPARTKLSVSPRSF